MVLFICREEFFKDVGDVVDVRFSSDSEGQFRGYGHVEFATAEEAKKVDLILLIGFKIFSHSVTKPIFYRLLN